MKKMRFLLILLLIAAMLPLSALAEPAIGLEMIMQYVPTIANVNGTDYLIISAKDLSGVGLYTSDGEQLLPCEYATLTYAANGFFYSIEDKEALNNRAIVSPTHGRISDFAYANLTALDDHWVIGFVYTPATEEANNVKVKDDFYWFDRVDFYYVTDEARDSYLVGSVTEHRYKGAAPHGEYVAVQLDDDSVQLYDSAFQPVDFEMAKTSDSIYGMNQFMVVNKLTGQTVLEGFTDVKEAKTADGLWLITGKFHWSGMKINSVFDQNCNLVYESDEYGISTITNRYAVLSGADKKVGLYSYAAGRVVVPVAFGKLITNKTSNDEYVNNGYVMVETDGLRGYVDTRTGEISCPLQYSPDGMKIIGCSMYWQREDGTTLLVAADGVETVLTDITLAGNRGDGSLLVAKKDNFFGLIDWHGNVMLPFEYSKALLLTDDTQHLIRTATGSELDRILPQ